jgi:hypothetical protein
MEGVGLGQEPPDHDVEEQDDGPLLDRDDPLPEQEHHDEPGEELHLDPIIQQAMEQSDQQSSRKRDPEY